MSVSDETLEATERLLRTVARVGAQRRQLKRSFDLADTKLRTADNEARQGLQAIVDAHGPVFTVRGSVTWSKGWTAETDDEMLLAWAQDARPGLVKQTVTQAALKEAGAKWNGGRMVLEGDVVQGMSRERSKGISVSLGNDDSNDYDDEEVEDNDEKADQSKTSRASDLMIALQHSVRAVIQ
jgi:hypothetical protein